jgi:hypothetical protein
VPIVVFVFVAVVGVCILALGYSLSSFEDQPIGRRCRMPYRTRHTRKVRRQRVWCRFEG